MTGSIIGVCYEVSNELGAGFLESVYQKALVLALIQKGFDVVEQPPLEVRFRGVVVGRFYPDLIVNNKVILELKAVNELIPEHTAQLINYLKATGYDTGLLVNFGRPKVECRRCWRPKQACLYP